jgi:adenylate cyclase
MSEIRKIAAILVSDVVGYSRLAGADEDRTLARLRALRSDLIDPTISVHHGRIVKRTGDGSVIEFRSVVDAVRCALEVQHAMVERNAGVAPDKRIEFRIGIHLGDVIEESDGDLMGDGVNITARLEGVCKPGAICLSEDAYRQVRDKVTESFTDLGEKELKNIARPVRVYELQTRSGSSARAPAAFSPEIFAPPRLSIVVLPFANIGGDPEQEYFVDGVTESLTTDLSRMRGMLVIGRNTAFTFRGKAADLKRIGRELNVRFVLEGSIQRSGNRMRVNVQLVDAETGNHLWVDRFDKRVAEHFDMQDEIVSRLANQLNAQLGTAIKQSISTLSTLSGRCRSRRPDRKRSARTAVNYLGMSRSGLRSTLPPPTFGEKPPDSRPALLVGLPQAQEETEPATLTRVRGDADDRRRANPGHGSSQRRRRLPFSQPPASGCLDT